MPRFETTLMPSESLQLYHKRSFISDRLTKSRISRFFSALQQEAAMADVALVGVEDWPSVVNNEPRLRCSPYWRTEAEYKAELEKLDPHHEYEKLLRKFGLNDDDVSRLRSPST